MQVKNLRARMTLAMSNTPYSKYTQTDYQGRNMPNSSRITSRRAKVIESNLMTQIALFGFLTVVLIVVFVAFVIPNVIKVLAGSSANQVATQTDTLLPQVPALSSPVEATNSAQLTLNGYSEKGNQVVVLDNSQEIKRVDAKDDGSFSADIDLQSGDNSLTAYAIKSTNQQQSAVSQAYLVKFDNEPPKLDISDPQDNQTINGNKNQQMTVKGASDPGVRVSLNDRLVIVKSDGSFTTSFQLNNGDNALDIKATDPAGNLTEKKLTVHFAP